MHLTRYGHAAVLVEHDGSRVLIDPGVFSVDATFALEELDAIVVTHQHPDHLDVQRIGALLERNPDALLLADPQTVELTAEQSDAGWTPTADGDVHQVGSLTLTGVGSTHAEILPVIPRIANVGVLVRSSDGQTLFHPGDTYECVPSDVDVLAVPLTAPWAKVSETVDFVQRVKPRITFPIHDCTASEPAQGMYWGQVNDHGGAPDNRRLGQTESTDVAR